MKKISILVSLAVAISLPTQAERILHIDMEADASDQLTENISNDKIRIYGAHDTENLPGAVGNAWRLDGYSSYATGTLSGAGSSHSEMTVSLWVAPETYPIVKHDVATTDKIILAGTLDETNKKGWAFLLDQNGKFSFKCYTGGWATEIEAPDPLPRYQWSRLVATVDASHAELYLNGEKVKTGNSMGAVDDSSRTIFIGKGSAASLMDGVFNLNTFNGLIDDLEVFDTVEDAYGMGALADNPADLSIPESRFMADLLRPRLHGMPASAWTNESHGMTYANGKFHIFFQKNANGPFMSRLHWGHISSPDFITWTEENIALFPDMNYDIKGCWSGCVFTDDVITGGKPNIIYTGVDYAKAYIAHAVPEDDDLIEWKKDNFPIINGRPGGLSDDFRDPYFFRNGDNAYIIVGTSKDGIGAVTLHKYLPAGIWTNNQGDIFFAGTDKASAGTFWEMPNITPMGNGKWLFTTTPQNTSQGVRTLYWTGEIATDGTFRPDAASAAPRGVELMSKFGFGLLSPTIYQHEGKTIALGIVPDKLAGNINYNLGWAHCYSLPREWRLDDKGNLLQKPYSGLRGARSDEFSYEHNDFTLDGSEELDQVSGRQVEILARFQVGTAPVGFKFFQSSGSEATLKYVPSANMLTVDLTKLNRTPNDNGTYNGTYTCVLPEKLEAGSEIKLNLFIDGSVIDIFVNDKWATSMRAFPTDRDANGVSAFSDGPSKVNELSAWRLNSYYTEGMDNIPFVEGSSSGEDENSPLSVFDLQGRYITTLPAGSDASTMLPSGIYIVGSKKLIVP